MRLTPAARGWAPSLRPIGLDREATAAALATLPDWQRCDRCGVLAFVDLVKLCACGLELCDGCREEHRC